MTPEYFLDSAVHGAMRLLPPTMDSREARAMLLAICLQESSLQHRKQVGGPARGYAQFESGGGVLGVLRHPASASHAKVVCAALDVAPTQAVVYAAIEQNDILAMAFARLLLWTLPDPLPGKYNPDGAWKQYLAAWRPGSPHPATWNSNYTQAWAYVEATPSMSIRLAGVRELALDLVAEIDKL